MDTQPIPLVTIEATGNRYPDLALLTSTRLDERVKGLPVRDLNRIIDELRGVADYLTGFLKECLPKQIEPQVIGYCVMEEAATGKVIVGVWTQEDNDTGQIESSNYWPDESGAQAEADRLNARVQASA